MIIAIIINMKKFFNRNKKKNNKCIMKNKILISELKNIVIK